MTSRDELDEDDDDFDEIYKEYAGPLGSVIPNTQQDNKTTTNKRSHEDVDDEESKDPNAVPTDFTSREAKVWEAKSKATERNWKKRKEDEMICKICGQSGHFTQGCPSTLGANRKSQDFFERVPAREPHVKALFSEKVVNKIEKDIGCKIKIEEKFIIVSGKDRLILKKGVDAVHKVKEEGENESGVPKFPQLGAHKVSSRSPISRSRSPDRRSPVTSQFGRSAPEKSNSGLKVNSAHVSNRYVRQEKIVEEHVREDLQSIGSSLQARAYGSDGDRSRPNLSKSPANTLYVGNSYNSYVPDMHSGRNFDSPLFSKNMEELELQHKREAMELARFRENEENEENYTHREVFHEMMEGYMKKVSMLKHTHDKIWQEFLQVEGPSRQQRTARQYVSTPAFDGYKQQFDASSGNIHQSETNNPNDSRSTYREAIDNYTSSRPHDHYVDFQRYRRDEFGRSYNRF